MKNLEFISLVRPMVHSSSVFQLTACNREAQVKLIYMTGLMSFPHGSSNGVLAATLSCMWLSRSFLSKIGILSTSFLCLHGKERVQQLDQSYCWCSMISMTKYLKIHLKCRSTILQNSCRRLITSKEFREW